MRSAEISALISVIFVTHNDPANLRQYITQIEDTVSAVFSDYETIIVDNGSTDQTLETLRSLTTDTGEANLQVYTLAGRVDDLTARWVGIENSLGDIVVCIEPRKGDLEYLNVLARAAASGNEIVFCRRTFSRKQEALPRRLLYKTFGAAAKISTGIDLKSYSTDLIAISRTVVNYLSQFPDPHIKFRNLQSTTGFRRTSINIPYQHVNAIDVSLRESLTRGIRVVTSNSESPLRLATFLAAIGALASLVYSAYVISVWASDKDTASGWLSLSLQLSGMFLLISLVLLVLSEYVIEISRRASSGPSFYIANEFTSARLKRKERLNVEVNRTGQLRSDMTIFRS